MISEFFGDSAVLPLDSGKIFVQSSDLLVKSGDMLVIDVVLHLI